MKKRLALASPFVLVTAVVVAWFIFSRHVPWSVPEAHRPPATWATDAGLTLTFLGVTGYALSDGVTTVLLDPTPTRPDPLELITGPVIADPKLGEQWCPKADLVLVNHAHFDHALDVGEIGARTGAIVAGSQNAVNLALSRGVAKEKTRVVQQGESFTVGTFTIDVRRSRHTDILVSQPMSGVIPPDAKALWFFKYALDDTFAYRLTSQNGGSVWFHPTSTYAAGELGGLEAQTLIVGVTGEKMTAEKARGLLGEAKARRVLPTHYDNFFQPMRKGLALMPGANLDRDKATFLEVDSTLEWGVLDYGQTVTLGH
ncbi:MAG: MBL fold metallo-hydrolase [Myxococcaceae bacterium]|nr:MBL fold metallo-hydrolase [Myxococcaceae bacterium]